MRLEHPALVMAAAPLVLALLLLARRGASPGRRPALAFAVRFLILMTLAAVLASPSVASPAPRSSVVFALDVSDSVPDESLEKAVDAIASASKAVSARGGTSALILFAGRAAVARPPSEAPIDFSEELRRRIFSRRAAKEAASEDRAQPREDLEPLRTRAQSALLLARRLHPPGGDARVVLLTDGEESDPGAQVSVGPGVRLIRLPKSPGADVALRALRAPLAVRAGEAFDVEVDAWAGRDTEARLSLTLDGQVISEDASPRTVRAGRSTLRIRSVQNALPQGLHRLQAFLSS
ncbi:MAG TPA: vWA domain-containing protein, partial [Planctomycetota bacterium]|nr:vWA domain-containing protein [Planctomycetota bacterium]